MTDDEKWKYTNEIDDLPMEFITQSHHSLFSVCECGFYCSWEYRTPQHSCHWWHLFADCLNIHAIFKETKMIYWERERDGIAALRFRSNRNLRHQNRYIQMTTDKWAAKCLGNHEINTHKVPAIWQCLSLSILHMRHLSYKRIKTERDRAKIDWVVIIERIDGTSQMYMCSIEWTDERTYEQKERLHADGVYCLIIDSLVCIRMCFIY